MNPGDGSPTGAADAVGMSFESAVREIERLYGDLLGVEAVSHALIDSYGQPSQGLPTPFPYTMPTVPSFQVRPRVAIENQAHLGTKLDQIFATAKGRAAGAAGWLWHLVDHVICVDTASIESAAQEQLRAIELLRTELGANFTSIDRMLTRFEGDTALAFGDYYQRVSIVLDQLIGYATAAQVGSAGTADVITVAKHGLVQSTQTAQAAFDAVLSAWRQDADNFPYPPGLVEQNVDEFTELVHKVVKYAEYIPKIGDSVEEVDKRGRQVMHVLGVAHDVIKSEQSHPLKLQPHADALFGGVKAALQAKASDVDHALATLAGQTSGYRDAVQRHGDGDLILPTERFPLHASTGHRP